MAAGTRRRAGSKPSLCRLLLVHALLLVASSASVVGLRVGFYQRTCPEAESIVRNVVWAAAAKDPTLAGKLLRAYFHDCFPQGCDASMLLDGPGTEKASDANKSLGGLDVVDAAKAALEEACPRNVSCADVLALAARDAVSFKFGRSLWQVETGRRDNRFSDKGHATNLPNPTSRFSDLKESFARRGLSVADLVALSGAHTLGQSDCQFVSPRLYNFTGSSDGVDPTLDRGYAQQLKGKCPADPSLSLAKMAMDPGSEFTFDTSYYRAVKANKGLFHSDAALMHDPESARLVDEMLDRRKFVVAFAAAIQRMGAYNVSTGNQGEIRKNCHFAN